MKNLKTIIVLVVLIVFSGCAPQKSGAGNGSNSSSAGSSQSAPKFLPHINF